MKAATRLLRRLAKVRRSASPVEELRHELDRLLGYYSIHAKDVPSRDLAAGNVVVYSNLMVSNPWPKVTAAHELAHHRLINSTPYGLFYRRLAGAPVRHRATMSKAVLAAQWTTQEAAATYLGLAAIARNKDQLDEAISSLPSGNLGESPYREAFDLVNTILPLEKSQETSDINTNIILVEAIASWALSGGILERFKTRKTATVRSLSEYLAANGPDVRLRVLIDRLRSTTELSTLRRGIQATIDAVAEEAGGFPNDDFWKVVGQLQDLLPLDSNIRLEERHALMKRFNRAWSRSSEREAREAWQAPEEPQQSVSEPEILPEVVVREPELVAYAPGLVDLTRGAELDVGYTIEELRDPTRGKRALLVTLVQKSPRSRLFFRPSVYPVRDDGVNPTHPDAAITLLMQSSGPIHTCDPSELVPATTSLPIPTSVLCFLGHSWTHWHMRNAPTGVPIVPEDYLASLDDGFDGCVRICLEWNLSEPHLDFLRLGAGLHDKPECFLLGFGRDEHVACIMDRKKPNIYLLQLVSGDLGFSVFDKIAARKEFQMLPVADGAVEIPHLPLLEFIGKLMVLEAGSSKGIVL